MVRGMDLHSFFFFHILGVVVVGRKGAFCDNLGNCRVSTFLVGAKSAFLAASAECLALTFEE